MDQGDLGGGAPPPGDNPHPPILQNETPNFLVGGASQAIQFLTQYGWFVLIGVVALVFLKTKFQPYIDDQRRRREEASEHRDYDEERTRQRAEAMEAHRRRLQEQHDAQAAQYAEQQKIKEEEKRQAKIEDWERHKKGLGYKSKLHKGEDDQPGPSGFKSSKSKKPLRDPDYNPLMGGAGGGAAFRPARRGGGG